MEWQNLLLSIVNSTRLTILLNIFNMKYLCYIWYKWFYKSVILFTFIEKFLLKTQFIIMLSKSSCFWLKSNISVDASAFNKADRSFHSVRRVSLVNVRTLCGTLGFAFMFICRKSIALVGTRAYRRVSRKSTGAHETNYTEHYRRIFRNRQSYKAIVVSRS